jgi:hypothetical protein
LAAPHPAHSQAATDRPPESAPPTGAVKPAPTRPTLPPMTPRQLRRAKARVDDTPLSRTLQRARVVRTAMLQRALTIRKVDFNPDTASELEARAQPIDDAFVNWTVEPEVLKARLTKFVNAPGVAYPAGNEPLKPALLKFIGPRLNTIGELDLVGDDVPDLATHLVTHLKGTTATTFGEMERMQIAVETALSASSFALAGHAGGTDFDDLLRNSGGGGSRKKGVPSKIAHAQLGAHVQGGLKYLIEPLVARNRLLVAGRQPFTRLLVAGDLGSAASTEMSDVRTHHVNKSGWLPAVVVPARQLPAAINALVAAKLPARVTGELATNGNTLVTEDNQKAYGGILAGVLRGLAGPRGPLLYAWSEYAQDFPYVEFSLGGSELSRMIYDYVNAKFYISAHYHWHKGYNPFFEVTGLSDL